MSAPPGFPGYRGGGAPVTTESMDPSLPDRVIAFYEDLAASRQRALDRLPDLFTDDIRFRDPFRETSGMPAFHELFASMFRRYKSVRFTGFRSDVGADGFTTTYDMHLRMALGPEFTTPFASVCRVRGDKVSELVDYYDFATGLVSPFPLAASLYRTVTSKLFL